MRVFTEQEKWILRKTATIKDEKNMHSISLSDICVVFLENEYISVNYNATNKFYCLEFFFDNTIYTLRNGNIIKKKQREIENKIIDTIFLLKFLKENNLLFEITDNKTSDNFIISKSKYNTSNHILFQTNFDSLTSKLVIETLVNKRYFIRQELIDFIKIKFQTPEDYRFRKSQIATWTGIAIAIIIGVISVLLVAFPSKSVIKNDDEDAKQIKSVESSIQLINRLQKSFMILDSTLLNSVNDNFGILNHNLITMKGKSIIKIDKNQFGQLESQIKKTPKIVVQLVSI